MSSGAQVANTRFFRGEQMSKGFPIPGISRNIPNGISQWLCRAHFKVQLEHEGMHRSGRRRLTLTHWTLNYIQGLVWRHWRRLVKNIGEKTQILVEQNVLKTDKCMGVSRFF